MKKKKVIEERRADAPRLGAIRFTAIIEEAYVRFLKAYSSETGTRITDNINEALSQWINRKRR
jgi:hypothetical protein